MDLTKISSGQRSPPIVVFFFLSLSVLIIQSCSLTSREPPPQGTKQATVESKRSLIESDFPAGIVIATYGKVNEEEKLVLEKNPALQCLLGKSDFSNATASDESILNAALQEAANQGVNNDDQEKIAKAKELIKTGKFYEDIFSATEVSVGLFPQIRKNIDINPNKALCLTSAVSSDIKGSVNNSSISDIVDNPTVLEEVLRCIYKEGIPKVVAQTASILLENDSIKLAIIAYSRANGINLKESDLDTLRNTILDTNDPDLDELVKVGKARLKGEFGIDKFDAIIQGTEKRQTNCEK